MKNITNLALIATGVTLVFGATAYVIKTNMQNTATVSTNVETTKNSEIDEIFQNLENTTTGTSLTVTTSAKTYESGEKILLNDKSVTISKTGNYTISGKISNGQLIVDAGENSEVVLNLAGVDISNNDSSAIFVKSGKVTLNLVEGTTNTISDGKKYSDDKESDSAVFSKEDLTIDGTGSLKINANFENGISSKANLTINNGNITVNSVEDAIKGSNSLLINGGNFSLNSEKGDGLKSNKGGKGTITINAGKFDITSASQGIKAYKLITLNNGTINIKSSNEGIEAEQIVINDGNLTIEAVDDGINASLSGEEQSNLKITINGGNIVVDAEGDGIDSNGDVEMNGGKVFIYGPTKGGNGSIDFDGIFNLNGGELISFGTADMAQNVSETSKQNTVSLTFDSMQSAGIKFTVKDSSGKVVLEGISKKSFQNVIFSTLSLKNGTYTYEINGSKAGEFSITGTTTEVGNVNRMPGGHRGGQFGGRNWEIRPPEPR
ncbi:carbohydrate-binding domain-containing protein [Candidatus Gracilibacteria bacterium]|nr:carbohydrate-binding domain-containing protein [Candidatus Gracilibacteria bacterium]